MRAKDNFGRNALHYAVIGNSFELVKMLLSDSNPYDPNEIDNEGFSPLALCIQGKKSNTTYYNMGVFGMADNIFMQLVRKGADVNIVYPEDSFKPGLREDEVDDQNYDVKGKYHTTPLINLIR